MSESGESIDDVLSGETGPQDHEEWVELASAYLGGYSATVGVVGSVGFLRWFTPDGVDSGVDRIDEEPSAEWALVIAKDWVEDQVRLGLDYGPSIYRIETDDVTGELPNNAEMVGFMCFVEAYDGAGGFGEYDIWFRPTEGDIVVCEENDPAIIGRFSSLQNLRDEIEVPATLDVWFEDRCNGKHGEWYPAPR